MTRQTFTRLTGYVPVRHGRSGWDRAWSCETLAREVVRRDVVPIYRHSLDALYEALCEYALLDAHGTRQVAAARVEAYVTPLTSQGINLRGVRI